MFIKYCVFSKILKYILDSYFPLLSVSVRNDRLNTSAAAELVEYRKITTFLTKNTIFNEHPVYALLSIKDIMNKNDVAHY